MDVVFSKNTLMKRNSFWLHLLLLSVFFAVPVLLIEGTASIFVAVRAARHMLYMQEESHSQYDTDLGWSHRPNLRIDDLYGGKTRFTINSQGLRAGEDFDRTIPPGKYRIVTLGDSFTMGYGVGDDATYPSQMQALCPALQTVNMGQGGYGVDQGYLWYKRDGVKLEANAVLFAIVAVDFYRMASDNFIGYPKPVLRVRNNALAVENVPVPSAWNIRTPVRRTLAFFESLAFVKIGRWLIGRAGTPAKEEWYGPVSDDVFAAARLAFDDLAALLKSRGQHLIVAYLPMDVLLAREPTPEAVWLEEYARRSGVPFINLVADFNRFTPLQRAQLFRPDHHYTVQGNHMVADALLRELAELIADFPDCEGGGTRPGAVLQ